MELIGGFKNPASILTGVYIKNGMRFLHSVIELEGEEDKYIVDYTLNLVINKETYVELTQFEELERIKDIEVMEDIKYGMNNFLYEVDFSSKAYLTFRQELKESIKKNQAMLQQSEDEKIDKRIEEIKKQREDLEKE